MENFENKKSDNMNNINVNLMEIIPTKMPSQYKLVKEKIENGKIKISVDKKGFEGGGTANSVQVKQFINLNNSFFELQGMIYGDGDKAIKGRQVVYGFTNNEISLHNRFLFLSKYFFGITPNQFKARVILPSNMEKKARKLEILFAKETGIPIENFWKYRIQIVRKPVFEIRFYSSIFGFVWNTLFEKTLNLLKNNKEFSAAFLSGLIATDGSVSLGEKKYPRNYFDCSERFR